MKLRKSHLILLFVIVFFFGTKTTYAQINVNVDPETSYQTMEGWGVSLAWWANLAGGMGDETINTLANFAVNDLNLNVFRFNIGGGENPNCTAGDHFRKDGGLMPGYRDVHNDNEGWGTYNLNNDQRQIKVMNKIAELRAPKGDLITEMISYSPPWWMTYGECSAGNVNSTSENLKPEFRDDFADYLVSVSKGLDTTYPDWNISYIVPFNEPTSGYWRKGGNQEGSAIYPATQATILWRLWQRKTALNFSSLKLSGSDNSKVPDALDNMKRLNTNNPGEYNGLAKITTHSYNGNWENKRDLANFAKANGNKPIWQTETGPLGWTPPAGGFWWQRHYDIAYRLIEDLRNLKATVWCDWQLMSRDDGWGMLHQTNWDPNTPYKKPNLNRTRGFYLRKNITNFIKVGYTIIKSNDGNTLAAISPDENEVVVVVLNNTNNTRNYSINLDKFNTINSFKTYRTSGGVSIIGENSSEKTATNITSKGVLNNKSLTYEAPAYSLTTFVVNVANSLSIESFKNTSVKVHPNPFTKFSTFEFPRKLNNATLIMYNTIGKEIKRIEQINKNTLRVNRDHLKNGIYIYKILEKSSILTSGKLIIN